MFGVFRFFNFFVVYNFRFDLFCRGYGCIRVFKYGKCRVKYEKKEYGFIVADEDVIFESKVDDKGIEDYVYNYGCFYFSIGFFFRSVDDFVKEGDGERFLRVWNFFIVFYRVNNYSKYVLVVFRFKVF